MRILCLLKSIKSLPYHITNEKDDVHKKKLVLIFWLLLLLLFIAVALICII